MRIRRLRKSKISHWFCRKWVTLWRQNWLLMFLTFLTIRTALTTLTIRVGNVKVGCMEVSVRFMHPTTFIDFQHYQYEKNRKLDNMRTMHFIFCLVHHSKLCQCLCMRWLLAWSKCSFIWFLECSGFLLEQLGRLFYTYFLGHPSTYFPVWKDAICLQYLIFASSLIFYRSFHKNLFSSIQISDGCLCGLSCCILANIHYGRSRNSLLGLRK